MWSYEEAPLGWWIVTDGVKEFQTQDEAWARWLTRTLNDANA